MKHDIGKQRSRSNTARWALAFGTAMLLIAVPAHATTFNELSNGDLSNDPTSPTNVGNLSLGDNRIVGETNPSGPIVDPMTGAHATQDNDYVSFTIPNGDALSQIILGPNSTFVIGDRMFFGIAQGAEVIVDPTFSSATGLLGWTLVDNSLIGSNLLPLLGASAPGNFPAIPGATGFTGPLSAGTYTLWLRDADQPASYDLDLVLTTAQIPEPATWTILLAGLMLVGLLFRLRASQRLQIEPSR